MASSSITPPPQTLPDNLIPGILLRVPPDDPAGLVRACAVCKDWRRIITDPAFPGRYRALHPTAPVLGFLHNPSNRDLPRFVSTTSFRPSDADHRRCHALDCRHGRVVFFDYGSLQSFVVWDPVTGELHKLPDVPDVLTRPAVVCAADGGCDDHRGCSGGPFIVAFVGVENIPEDHYFDAHACLYASDTGEWSVHINIHLDHGRYYPDDRPAGLVGDSLYFFCGRGILRYRYGLLQPTSSRVGSIPALERTRTPTSSSWRRRAAGWDWPACVLRLVPCYLLARETESTTVGTVGDVGAAAAAAGRWVQRRVIDLKMLLPVGNLKRQPCLSGVAQDANVIFVSTEDGVFAIELGGSPLQARKVCEMKGLTGVVNSIYPFVIFYTESLLLKLASGKLPLPAPVGNQ